MRLRSTLFLKVAVWIIGITVFAMCVFWFPSLARDAAKFNPEIAYLRYPVLIGLYMTTLPFYFALYQALTLLNNIEKGNAFSKLAVISLGHIKNCALIIIVLYVIGMFLLAVQNALHPGLAIIGGVIIFAATVISLFAAVLQELLRSALNLKTENELTI
ncbi:DUF2975 domain-containing protein [Paenibacillus sp. VCA1]|uniref:DUF2975 domain-containing protein n=1 Tax=Paenibacillus sp. VCA1 TaxID=3039148 RepID=UPI002870FE0C|nr:DUF2975 domain-containing protein [Paenibacillus sp. VCA1]MDR9855151.1 DUF2975 domain-containing protein [Paenibacillus sp. VCA1]